MKTIILNENQFKWISTYPRGCVIDIEDDVYTVDVCPYHLKFKKTWQGYEFELHLYDNDYERWNRQFNEDFLYAYREVV